MPVEFVLEPLVLFLSVISGIAVGFSLGLIGGGGSILAVPLLLYVVGVRDVHVAIGTSALAVGAIAAINLIGHKRKNNVQIKKEYDELTAEQKQKWDDFFAMADALTE